NAERGGPRILLSSHGRGCEIGSFLHEPEKLSLFDALSAALYRVKNPRFDNPQLRDG
ncbi:MAG: Integral rane protein, partial [Acetobacteraceae bacterium]|nr:Integral rane protein [Acetobacteraceae bacterium]